MKYEKVCKHAINCGCEHPACNCYYGRRLMISCEYQDFDYNPDGSLNIVMCLKYQTGGIVKAEA